MLSNTRTAYGGVAKGLHWLTAALIVTMIPLGLWMHNLPQATSADVAYKAWAYSLHKTIGIAAFAVALLRVGWALAQPRPAPLHPDRRLETRLAEVVHWLLYTAILMMPITGWLHHAATEGFAPIWWPLGQDLPGIPKDPDLAHAFKAAHEVMWLILGLSLILHIAGALKHAVLDRDGTLRRMIPGLSAPEAPGGAHAMGRLPGVVALLAVAGVVAVATFDPFAPARQSQAAPAAATSGWAVDPEASQLDIEIVQFGKPAKGTFEAWTADIQFDPDRPEDADIRVMVQIGSLRMGTVTEQAMGPDFLDAERHPTAEFQATDIVRNSDGSFTANGTLTLVGQAHPLALPFTLQIAEDRADVTAETRLSRMTYGIGATGFPDEKSLGFDVIIRVTLQAQRVTPANGS